MTFATALLVTLSLNQPRFSHFDQKKTIAAGLREPEHLADPCASSCATAFTALDFHLLLYTGNDAFWRSCLSAESHVGSIGILEQRHKTAESSLKSLFSEASFAVRRHRYLAFSARMQ